MGVFKKCVLTKTRSLHVSSGAYREDPDEQPEIEDEVEIEDQPRPSDEGNSPLKRRVRQCTAILEEEEDSDADSDTVSTRLKAMTTAKAAKRDTVRLSTDIEADLHTRLRLHSIKTKKSLIAIIEQWIVKYCPE